MIRKIKTALAKEYNNEPLYSIAVIILLVGLVSFVTAGLASPKSLENLFGRLSDIIFTDHFSSICYSLDHPYTEHNVIYPALINDIYYVLGCICKSNLDHYTGDLKMDMFNSSVPMLLCVIFLIIGVVLLLVSVRYLLNGRFGKNHATIILLLLLITCPMIAMFQVGNCIVYSVFFTIVFFAGYRSDKKWVRYIAYLSICIASNIKLSPIILSLLVLKEKRYMEYAHLILIFVLMYTLPFLFTDGNPLMVIENILKCPEDLGGANTNLQKIGVLLSKYTGITLLSDVFMILSEVLIAIAALLCALDKKTPWWMLASLACCAIVIGPGIGTRYLALNLIPALILLLKYETEPTCVNILLVICFSISLMLIPADYCVISTVMTSVATVALLVLSLKNTLASNKGTITEVN